MSAEVSTRWSVRGVSVRATLEHAAAAPAGSCITLTVTLTPDDAVAPPSSLHWAGLFANLRLTAAPHTHRAVLAVAQRPERGAVVYTARLELPHPTRTLDPPHAPPPPAETRLAITASARPPLLVHEAGSELSEALHATFAHNASSPPAEAPMSLTSEVAVLAPLALECIAGATADEASGVTSLRMALANCHPTMSVTVQSLVAVCVEDEAPDAEGERAATTRAQQLAPQLLHDTLPIVLPPGCSNAMLCLSRQCEARATQGGRSVRLEACWSIVTDDGVPSFQTAPFLVHFDGIGSAAGADFVAWMHPPRSAVRIGEAFNVSCELHNNHEVEGEQLTLVVDTLDAHSQDVRLLASVIRLPNLPWKSTCVDLSCMAFEAGPQPICLQLSVVVSSSGLEPASQERVVKQILCSPVRGPMRVWVNDH